MNCPALKNSKLLYPSGQYYFIMSTTAVYHDGLTLAVLESDGQCHA